MANFVVSETVFDKGVNLLKKGSLDDIQRFYKTLHDEVFDEENIFLKVVTIWSIFRKEF